MTELLSRFLSFSVKLIWKMSPLVLDEMLGVFVNTLTADGMYPVQVCEICKFQFKCNYLKNEKRFLDFWFPFLNLDQILNIWKKTWLSHLMYFWYYRLWKPWLEDSLKSAVSEHALTVNMWKRPKCFLYFHESAFVMFFYHSQGSWFRKCLP